MLATSSLKAIPAERAQPPGELFQFDWSEDFAVIGGERTKLQIAHFKLICSRAFLLCAYPLQTHEMLFDAHVHAFPVLGGVPRRGIYDNMRTTVDRIGRGKARDVNLRFAAIVSHYLYGAEFRDPASGCEKGQIEKNMHDSRHRIWTAQPANLPDLAALNAWLEARRLALWRELPHLTQPGRAIAKVWQEEQLLLMQHPVPFDGFIEQSKRVTPICIVHVDRNHYSVPAIRRQVQTSCRGSVFEGVGVEPDRGAPTSVSDMWLVADELH